MTVINDRSMQEEINDSLKERVRYMKAELSGGFEYGSGGIAQKLESLTKAIENDTKEFEALVTKQEETLARIVRIENYLNEYPIKEQSK